MRVWFVAACVWGSDPIESKGEGTCGEARDEGQCRGGSIKGEPAGKLQVAWCR